MSDGCPKHFTEEARFGGVGSQDHVYICRHGNRRIAVKPIATSQSPNLRECRIFQAADQFCDNENRSNSVVCADRKYTRCDANHRLAVDAVAGRSMDHWIKEMSAAGQRPSFQVWSAVAVALIEAAVDMWKHDMVHRDIKPGNVMMVDNALDRLTLIDLGTACPFSSNELCLGSAFGSKSYLPTELVNAFVTDIRVHMDRYMSGTFALLHDRYGSVGLGLLNMDAYMVIMTIFSVMTATLFKVTRDTNHRVADFRNTDWTGCDGKTARRIVRSMIEAIEERRHDHLPALRRIYRLLRPDSTLQWVFRPKDDMVERLHRRKNVKSDAGSAAPVNDYEEPVDDDIVYHDPVNYYTVTPDPVNYYTVTPDPVNYYTVTPEPSWTDLEAERAAMLEWDDAMDNIEPNVGTRRENLFTPRKTPHGI